VWAKGVIALKHEETTMTPLFKRFIHVVLWFVVLVEWSLPVVANDDFIIILDHSASMREKQPGNPSAYLQDPLSAPKSREAVKAINDVVINLLREGDYFALIIFGNHAELVISQVIRYQHERVLIQRQCNQLRFDDRKTDIVAGIKAAGDLLAWLNTPMRRKILVLITDGMNDPPVDSLYKTSERQQEVFQNFREAIRLRGWNVNMVGLGAHTDIPKIADDLGLSKNRVFALDDLKSGQIEKSLGDLLKKEQRARIELREETVNVKIRLQPRLLGGYKVSETKQVLTSYFNKPVEVRFNTRRPLVLQGAKGLHISITPLNLNLVPNQPTTLTLSVSFDGRRPEEGRINGSYSFKLAEESLRFYPQHGKIEAILPSWWESYGSLTIAAASGFVILLGCLGWIVRRTRVPEVRVLVTSNNGPLGEPITLRRGENFKIANNQFVGRVVPATGLSCNTAAIVRYLGLRKFELIAEEAKINQLEHTFDRLTVGIDVPFDLKDREGKVLRDVMISKPGRVGDIFGGSHDSDPF
jgi:Mg-chelatase subunit ChlD